MFDLRTCAEKSSIDEPLLEHDRQNFDPTSDLPSTSEPSSSAVVPHSINRVDWEQLLQTLVTSCHAGLQSLWGKRCTIVVTSAVASLVADIECCCSHACQLLCQLERRKPGAADTNTGTPGSLFTVEFTLCENRGQMMNSSQSQYCTFPAARLMPLLHDQAQRLEELQTRMRESFDPENPIHQVLVKPPCPGMAAAPLATPIAALTTWKQHRARC